MSQRHASNASARWGVATAIRTDGWPTGTRPAVQHHKFHDRPARRGPPGGATAPSPCRRTPRSRGDQRPPVGALTRGSSPGKSPPPPRPPPPAGLSAPRQCTRHQPNPVPGVSALHPEPYRTGSQDSSPVAIILAVMEDPTPPAAADMAATAVPGEGSRRHRLGGGAAASRAVAAAGHPHAAGRAAGGGRGDAGGVARRRRQPRTAAPIRRRSAPGSTASRCARRCSTGGAAGAAASWSTRFAARRRGRFNRGRSEEACPTRSDGSCQPSGRPGPPGPRPSFRAATPTCWC